MKNNNITPVPSEPKISKSIIYGAIVFGIFLFLFIIWGSTAPLESAASAPGKIIVAGHRKTIQHLEGGIIKDILVKEGSTVKANQPLIKLEDTQARASYELLKKQTNELLATKARLQAEEYNYPKIIYPERLLKEPEPEIKSVMYAQQKAFENNKQTLAGQLQILQQRVQQLKEEIKSVEAQITSETQQYKLINEEMAAVKYLEAQKLIDKPRLLALQREAARLLGNRGQHQGMIAQAQQKIGEAQQQILTLKDTHLKDILKELDETNEKLSASIEKEKAAKDIYERTLIRAPIEGTVVGLLEHTIGGVISPGKPIMDIQPSQGELIVEARVRLNDINVVHKGLKAKVQLSAYKQRRTPWLDGTVTYVSADSFQDPKTNESYYLAYIAISPDSLTRVKDIVLYPGMEAHTMIIVSRRTFFDYLFTPIVDSFYHAFRES